MTWRNGALTVYHGTDDVAAAAIIASGVSLSLGRAYPDFGPGFYTTTYRHQAEQWANQRVRRLGGASKAAVVAFSVNRTALGSLAHLAFVADTADFYDLVDYSRSGALPIHGRKPCYDVVYGPVSLWPQTLTIHDCDQISFHTIAGIGVLSSSSILATRNPFF